MNAPMTPERLAEIRRWHTACRDCHARDLLAEVDRLQRLVDHANQDAAEAWAEADRLRAQAEAAVSAGILQHRVLMAVQAERDKLRAQLAAGDEVQP